MSVTVDGTALVGRIDALYPNDMTVTLTQPVSGFRSGLHVPYFAMASRRLAATVDGRTTITSEGQRTAEWLLGLCYEYSLGKRGAWRVDVVTDS